MTLRRAIFAAAGAWAIWQGGKFMLVMQSKHFTVSEFKGQLPFLTYGLLQALFAFREEIGTPVVFSSPESGGLFRMAGEVEDSAKKSQHFYGRAADVKWPQGVSKARAFEVAKKHFSGVGVYPWGLHLDVRPERVAGNPATWGRIYYANGTFEDVSAAQVLASLA